MPVDAPPFDGIVVDVAPGANPAASPSTFDWQYAGKRRKGPDIVIAAGRDDEATNVEAGSLDLTFDDRDGRLSPRNILGEWYGQLRRGTPVRVRWDRTSDAFTRTVSGSWGSNPDGFSWTTGNVNGTYGVNGTQATVVLPTNNAVRAILNNAGSVDAEVSWSTAVDVMPTGGALVSAAMFRHVSANSMVRAHIELQPAGTIAVKIQKVSAAGVVDVVGITTVPGTYTTGAKVWGKARADGPYVMVKAWTGLVTDEPDAWQAVGIDDVTEGSQTGLYIWRLYTNVATITPKIDDFEIVNLLWSGNVPEWPVRWPDKSGRDSTTPIVAAGVLRRLQQGSSALVSPLRQQLGGLAYGHAYYPMEDGSTSTSAASGLSRKPPAVVTDVTFAADDTLPGASTTTTLNTAGVSLINAQVNGPNTADGYAFMLLFKLPSMPVDGTDLLLYRVNATGTATRWDIVIDNTGIGYNGYDRDGTSIASAFGAWGDVDPRDWVAVQLETNVSGGTVNVSMIYHQIGSTEYLASTDSYAGTATRPTSFSVHCPIDGTSIGHVWLGDNDLPFVDDTFSLVSNGYIGEQAGDRIARLCAGAGVPVVVMAGETEPMGRQKVAKLVDLLRECEAADQGVLYERGLALAYTPRVRRYNVPVLFTMPWEGAFADPPEPTDDDQRLRNQWTVNRVDGSSATAADQADIDAHGLYDDQTDLNIASDGRLFDFAAWFVNIGTNDELRWPRVTFDLIKHPELIPAMLAMRIGSRFTITDPPTQIAGETIDLVIEGYTHRINLHKWEVELSCSPARPWEIGVYDDASARYDAIANLDADMGPTDTWAPIIAADRNGFYSSTSCPYDVMISGQRNTVKGMSAPDSLAQADGTFEDGIGYGWNASNCTAVDSTAQAHRGTHSALFTVVGSPVEATLRANLTHAAAPGDVVTSSSWIYSTTAQTIAHHVDWYNGASFLSRNGTSVAVPANTWTQISVTATAPASTTRLEYGPSRSGSPAAGTFFYVDDVECTRSSNPNSRQLALLARGVDGFTKSLTDGDEFRIANPARYGL